MAGIEEAFEKFVTRVSGRERSPAEQPLSKYKSYSEQELLENIEAKYPNQLQSFSQEDYQLNTMPMFEPKDVAPYKSYSPMPVEKYLRGRDYMDLAQGGVASMFRERPGYAEGGTYPSFIDGPNGIKFELVTGRFSGKPVYKAKYPEDYDFSKGAIGGSTATEFDPDQINQIAIEEQNRRENLLGKTFPEGYFDPATYEIPTVDPFSGEQVSAQEQAVFTQPQPEIFPQQELPTVQPEIFSQQPSLIDTQLPVSNNPALTNLGAFFGINDPIKDFSQFNPETQKILSDTIMRSLPYSDNPNNLDIDYKKYGTEGAPVFQGGYSNILDQAKAGLNALMGDPAEQLRMAYGRFNVNIDPATQTAYMKDTYDFNQGGENNLLNKIGTPYKVNIALPKELTQNIINSPYYQNALAQSSPDQFKNLRAQGSQQEAAARVTPRMAYGGRVSMSDGGLTTTVPPDKGPDSQGVESLFRRRYS